MTYVKTGLAALMLASFSTGAIAQANCAHREVVVKRLAERYDESFTGGGMRDGQAVFEVWASKERGTWTILLTQPSGLSCVMASGTNWRDGPAIEKIGTPS